MPHAKADIIAKLRRDLLPLQGYRSAGSASHPVRLGIIDQSFPNNRFPTGAIHEFVCSTPEDQASTSGFILGLMNQLAGNSGICLWVTASRTIFPPGIVQYGIEPHRLIFVEPTNLNDCLWATEEALNCESVSAVVCETSKLSFTASRRLQLSVEQTGVTGLIIHHTNKPCANACVARWQITPKHSVQYDALPGVGAPMFNVELLKVRNGRSGRWDVVFETNRFSVVREEPIAKHILHRKAG
jgi:protein ImuA